MISNQPPTTNTNQKGMTMHDELATLAYDPTTATEVELLKNQIAELEARNVTLSAKVGELLVDFERANEILNDAADAADLCDKYEEALAAVNRRMRHYSFKGREKDWAMTVTLSFSVEARTRDEAVELAKEYITNGDASEYDIDDVEAGAE